MSIIEVLKSKVSIKDVLKQELNIDIGLSSIKCPFHEDDKPSFSITNSDDGEIASCFAGSCDFGTNNDVINVIQYIKGFSTKEAIRYLVKNYLKGSVSDCYVSFPTSTGKNINKYSKTISKIKYRKKFVKAIEYIVKESNKFLLQNKQLLEELFVNRGITKKFVEDKLIGFFSQEVIDNLPQDVVEFSKVFSDFENRISLFKNRFLFPYYTIVKGFKREFYGFIARKRFNDKDNTPKYLKIKDVSDGFFAFYSIPVKIANKKIDNKNKLDLYLTEGVFDQSILLINNISALSLNGTTINEYKLMRLERSYYKNERAFVIALDNDVGGRLSSILVVERLMSRGFYVKGILDYANYDDVKDPCEFVLKYGVDEFKKLPILSVEEFRNKFKYLNKNSNFRKEKSTKMNNNDINNGKQKKKKNKKINAVLLKSYRKNRSVIKLYRTSKGYKKYTVNKKSSKVEDLTNFTIEFKKIFFNEKGEKYEAEILVKVDKWEELVEIDLEKVHNLTTLMTALSKTYASINKKTEDIMTIYKIEYRKAIEENLAEKIFCYHSLGHNVEQKKVFFKNAIIDTEKKSIYFSDQDGFISIDGYKYIYQHHDNYSRKRQLRLLTKDELYNFLMDYYQLWGETGLLSLSWVLGSLEKEFYIDLLGQYHLLSIVSQKGTGKTKLLTLLAKLIGTKAFGIDNSTKASIRRDLNSVSNFPLFYDEYNNFSSYKDSILKGAFNNDVLYKIADRDNDEGNIEYNTKASIMIVGEALSQTASLVDRCLLLEIKYIEDFSFKYNMFSIKYDNDFLESVVSSLYFYKIKKSDVGINRHKYLNLFKSIFELGKRYKFSERENNMFATSILSFKLYIMEIFDKFSNFEGKIGNYLLKLFLAKKELVQEENSMESIFNFIITETRMKKIDVKYNIHKTREGDFLIGLFHIFNQANLKKIAADYGSSYSILTYIRNKYKVKSIQKMVDGKYIKRGFLISKDIVLGKEKPKNEFEQFLKDLVIFGEAMENNEIDQQNNKEKNVEEINISKDMVESKMGRYIDSEKVEDDGSFESFINSALSGDKEVFENDIY